MKTKLKNETESLLWVAKMNEQSGNLTQAIKLYEQAGDFESAERCRNAIATNQPTRPKKEKTK